MDHLDELIPILGMLLTLGPLSVLAVSFTPLGRALVDRLKGKSSHADERLLDMQDEVERLQDQVSHHEARVEELHDRLDFAERLLLKRGDGRQESVDKISTPV